MQRKKDHLLHAASDSVDHSVSINPFDEVDLPYTALPELDLASIDLTKDFLGQVLSMPLLISSMSGGMAEAQALNEVLALAAQEERVALGLGSMRVIIERPETAGSFDVKQHCPSVPLLGNLGAVQLNYGVTLEHVQQLVDQLRLDAMILHLNALQEAVQPEGDVRFEGLLKKIEAVVRGLDVPVMVKEVGAGLSAEDVRRLVEIGVTLVDVSGVGGTSWAKIEGMRRTGPHRRLGDVFHAWGTPTPVAIHQARRVLAEQAHYAAKTQQQRSGQVSREDVQVIAGGGVRSGLDIAKACFLGADLATMARPFLLAYQEGDTTDKKVASVRALIRLLRDELRIACFGAGVARVADLRTLASFEEEE